MSVAVSDSAFYLNVLLYLAIFDETRKVFRPSNCLDVFLKLVRFVECRIGISYPLTDRPTELWIAETNQDRHEQWRTLESFLTTLHLTFDDDTIHEVANQANQWRRYYDIPPLRHSDQPSHHRHLLPHPHQSNIHLEHPVPVVPEHTPLLQACWGRSAARHSQCDPSLTVFGR